MPSSLGRPRSRTTRSGWNAAACVERRLAVAGEAHLVALQPQRALERLGDLLVVLDDEHARVAAAGIHLHGQGYGDEVNLR